MDSQEIFFDALEEAPVAYLDPEEANLYLKSVLKVESKTVSKNSSVSVAGDALNSANYIVHKNPWTMVTRRHPFKHARPEPRPPNAEGGDAGHHWQKTYPGLYDASLLKKKNYQSAPLKYGKGSSAPTNTKSKSNKDNSGMGYRKEGMPRHLVKELDILDTMEFEVALDYWMEHFNFVYQSNKLIAYDESIYPDARNKPSERHRKNKFQSKKIPSRRDCALVFACQALVEYSQHQRLATHVVSMAYEKSESLRGKANEHDENYLENFQETKFYPNMFAQVYSTARHLNPHGYNVFIMDINKNNRQHDLVRRIRGQRRKLINFWMHTARLTREIDKATGVDPCTYRPRWNRKGWQRKRPPSAKGETQMTRRSSNNASMSNHSHGNLQHIERTTKYINMVNQTEQSPVYDAPYNCCATQEQPTPLFINRLHRAIVPVIAAVQATPSMVRQFAENQNVVPGPTSTSSPTTPPPSIDVPVSNASDVEDSIDLSVVISDSTQATSTLRAELLAATSEIVTPTPYREKQPSALSAKKKKLSRSKDEKKPKSKKKKKQSGRRSRHTKRRPKHNTTCSPDGGDDSSSSSSSSSWSPSNSSYSELDDSSGSDSEDSVLVLDSTGNIMDVAHIVDSKERFNTSRRIATQVKKLSTSAKLHDLKEFITVKGTIEDRKSFFKKWANKLQEMLTSHFRYQALLRDYPRLNASELTITGNTALGQFLRLKLHPSALHTIEATIGRENRHNGFMILQYLFNTYGSSTFVDARNAKEKLESTFWSPRDTIDSFTHRFMYRLSQYNDSISTNSTQRTKTYSSDEVTILYLHQLVTTIPTTHNLYREVETTYSKCERDLEAFDQLDTNLSNIQHRLQRLELTYHANTNETRSNMNPQSYRNFRRPLSKRPTEAPPRQKANTVLQSRKFKGVKCWGCGHNHHLRDCPTTSAEERHRLWEEHRNRSSTKPNSTKPKTTDPHSKHTNHCQPSEATQHASTLDSKPKKINMSSKKEIQGLAFATVHHANLATPYQPNSSQPNQSTKPITSINDWLIDSGCSAHMTNCIEDFIGNLETYETLVECANGGVTHVTHRGKTEVLIRDIFHPNHSVIVQLNNVLYVPGLNRRLISVSEWNSCGGQITFLQDRTRLEIFDSDQELITAIDTQPICGTTGITQLNSARVRSIKPPPMAKLTKVSQSLLHRRLGHRSMSTVMMAHEDALWNDVEVVADPEDFCETCRITTARKANRGSAPLEELQEIIPGTFVMIDIVNNPADRSITANTYYPYYLAITDVASRFFVPMGITDKKAKTVFRAIQEWASSYGPSATFNLSQLTRIHGDFDTTFRSNELSQLARDANINVSFAAPRHQEQNGICESNWRNVRNLAFACLNEAKMDMSYFPCALEQAWKIHSVLPHKALTKIDGTVQCPLGVYTGAAVSVSNFRVLFCPVVMTYDNVIVSRPKAETNQTSNKHPRLETLNRKNSSQRGMRGIHVGLPRHSFGYLVFVPSTGRIYNSADVYFDEDFNSTLAYETNKFSGYIDITITDPMPDTDLPTHYTGSPLMFAKQHAPGHIRFAQAQVKEVYDDKVTPTGPLPPTLEDSLDSDSDSDSLDDGHDEVQKAGGEDNNINKATNEKELEDNDITQENKDIPDIDDDGSETTCEDDDYFLEKSVVDQPLSPDMNDSIPPLLVRRSTRRRYQPDRYTASAHAVSSPDFPWIPRDLTVDIEHAYHLEVEKPIDITKINPELLLPAPDNWKQVLKLPPHIKKLWINSFAKELKELIKKGTVEHDTPNDDDPIIPVTAKHRVKLTSDGLVEKLKTRIALRGDLMRENFFVPDTWCPIAGFRALKIFLAYAAECKQRVYQLDYVAAFLQAEVLGRKFTIFPKGWIELLQDYPDLHQWLGVPLRLKKSLYGDRVANLAWDETQSKWLTSKEIGFHRLQSEGSIYIKWTEVGFIAVLNAVDDQLYFATDVSLKKWFEVATQSRFDVQLMGQATWYLQSRITQCTDFSIILDQSRYAALVLQRYINHVPDIEITQKMKDRYATPIPTTAVFTKEDCSRTYSDVAKIQQEFGFEYAAVIGSLIYLMNTYIKLNYAIRKLARFMQYPGQIHFKLLLHLLRHLQCYRRNGGIKFYSDKTQSPLHNYLSTTGNGHLTNCPIIAFSDSSFQDCPDTARSTGGYLVFIQGAVVDVASTMPSLVAYSTCEAEYSTCALAAMAAFYIKKIYNELHGFDPDHQLTIPIGIDSKSAMDTANSHKETQRTRHIARRFHFIRFAIGSSQIILFKVDGTNNCANSLTKPLTAERLASETAIYEVEVDP